eukprot:GHVT01045220.1.p1 GENE.GHVT01045220.1~~GHVT01045220.1.p1  ORF type:complete len:652 (+),score=65.11 GHVT01045220.1:622-2577(+)
MEACMAPFNRIWGPLKSWRWCLKKLGCCHFKASNCMPPRLVFYVLCGLFVMFLLTCARDERSTAGHVEPLYAGEQRAQYFVFAGAHQIVTGNGQFAHLCYSSSRIDTRLPAPNEKQRVNDQTLKSLNLPKQKCGVGIDAQRRRLATDVTRGKVNSKKLQQINPAVRTAHKISTGADPFKKPKGATGKRQSHKKPTEKRSQANPVKNLRCNKTTRTAGGSTLTGCVASTTKKKRKTIESTFPMDSSTRSSSVPAGVRSSAFIMSASSRPVKVLTLPSSVATTASRSFTDWFQPHGCPPRGKAAAMASLALGTWVSRGSVRLRDNLHSPKQSRRSSVTPWAIPVATAALLATSILMVKYGFNSGSFAGDPNNPEHLVKLKAAKATRDAALHEAALEQRRSNIAASREIDEIIKHEQEVNRIAQSTSKPLKSSCWVKPLFRNCWRNSPCATGCCKPSPNDSQPAGFKGRWRCGGLAPYLGCGPSICCDFSRKSVCGIECLERSCCGTNCCYPEEDSCVAKGLGGKKNKNHDQAAGSASKAADNNVNDTVAPTPSSSSSSLSPSQRLTAEDYERLFTDQLAILQLPIQHPTKQRAAQAPAQIGGPEDPDYDFSQPVGEGTAKFCSQQACASYMKEQLFALPQVIFMLCVTRAGQV